MNSSILVVGMLTERGEKARHVTYVSRVHEERELSEPFVWVVSTILDLKMSVNHVTVSSLLCHDHDPSSLHSLQLSSVFGSTTFSSSRFYWMVIDLNFTDVVPDKCSSPNDYFQWIPTDEVTGAVMKNGHKDGLECRLELRLISRVE